MSGAAEELAKLGTRTALPRLIALLGLWLLHTACEKGIPTVSSFSISPGEATVLVGGSVQLTAVGAPRDLLWSSSNSNVASVVPETGYVTGEARGNATVSAVAGSVVASSDIIVLAPPEIGVPAAVEFEMMHSDPDPAPVVVGIENGGDIDFEGLMLGPTEYTEGEPQGWLELELDAAPEEPSLTLRAIRRDLSPGVFAAVVQIIADNAANSPQSILVTFRIVATGSPPVLAIAPPSLSFSTFAHGAIPTASAVIVTNAGAGTIGGLTATLEYSGADGWLEVMWENGQTDTPARLIIEPTTSALERATHTAAIHISSATPDVNDQTVDMTYSISTFRCRRGTALSGGGSRRLPATAVHEVPLAIQYKRRGVQLPRRERGRLDLPDHGRFGLRQ